MLKQFKRPFHDRMPRNKRRATRSYLKLDRLMSRAWRLAKYDIEYEPKWIHAYHWWD